MFADEREMEEFLATVCTQSWNEEQDLGRPFAEGVQLLIESHPHRAQEIRAYDERWDEMLKGPIDDSVVLLGELRERGVSLFALTNWSAEKFPVSRSRFAFFDWFEGIIVSGEELLKKPDPQIFRLAARRFGLDPAVTLLVDDSAPNIAAADATRLSHPSFRRRPGLAQRARRARSADGVT